jgi:hypothetical protein
LILLSESRLYAHQHREPGVYFRRKTSAGRAYLQIVESRRDGDQVRQQVIATLGRYEELQESGLTLACSSCAGLSAHSMLPSPPLAEQPRVSQEEDAQDNDDDSPETQYEEHL